MASREIARSRLVIEVSGPMTITLHSECVSCDKHDSTRVDFGAYAAWVHGVHPQQAWPDSTPDWREFWFVSGLCSTCWDSMFLPHPPDVIEVNV